MIKKYLTSMQLAAVAARTIPVSASSALDGRTKRRIFRAVAYLSSLPRAGALHDARSVLQMYCLLDSTTSADCVYSSPYDDGTVEQTLKWVLTPAKPVH